MAERVICEGNIWDVYTHTSTVSNTGYAIPLPTNGEYLKVLTDNYDDRIPSPNRGEFYYNFTTSGHIGVRLTNLGNYISATAEEIDSGHYTMSGTNVFKLELYNNNNVLISSVDMSPVSPTNTETGTSYSYETITVPGAGLYYLKLKIGSAGTYVFYAMECAGNSVVATSMQFDWQLYTRAVETFETCYVEGYVKDYNTADNIVAANVTLQKSPNIGTVTDINGKFKLGPISDKQFSDDSIDVSYIGYKVQSVPIKSTSDLGNIYLLEYSGSTKSTKIASVSDFRSLDSNSFKDNPRIESEMVGSFDCGTFDITNKSSVTTQGTDVVLNLLGGTTYKIATFTTPSNANRVTLFAQHRATITAAIGTTAIQKWSSVRHPAYVYIVKGETFAAGAPGFAEIGTFAPTFGTDLVVPTTEMAEYNATVEPNTKYSIFITDGPQYQMVRPMSSNNTTITSGSYMVNVAFSGISGPFHRTYETGTYNPAYCPPYIDVAKNGVFITVGDYANNQCVKFGDLSKFRNTYISSLYFNGTNATLYGGESKTLSVTGVIDKKGVTLNNDDLTWTSSNSTIASVNKGVVVANTSDYEGTAVITAKTTKTQSGSAITTNPGYNITVKQLRLDDFMSINCHTNGFEPVVGTDWNTTITIKRILPSSWVGTTIYFKVYNENKELIAHPSGANGDWYFSLTNDITTDNHAIIVMQTEFHSHLGGTKDNPVRYAKITNVSSSIVKYRGSYINVTNT